MNMTKTLGAILAAATIASIPATQVFAQAEGGGGLGVYGGGSRAPYMTAGIAPHKAGSGEACPGLTWHFNRTPNPDKTVTLSGPIWYNDGKGVSFANGTGQADGTFSLNVASVSGNGPSGTVSGRRLANGSTDVTVSGSPCFSGTYHLQPGQTTARS